jgi:hypothetical protein
VCTHDGLVIKVALDAIDWFRRIHAPFWWSELSIVVAHTKGFMPLYANNEGLRMARSREGGSRHQSGQTSEDGECLHVGGAVGCDYIGEAREHRYHWIRKYSELSTSRFWAQQRDEII